MNIFTYGVSQYKQYDVISSSALLSSLSNKDNPYAIVKNKFGYVGKNNPFLIVLFFNYILLFYFSLFLLFYFTFFLFSNRFYFDNLVGQLLSDGYGINVTESKLLSGNKSNKRRQSASTNSTTNTFYICIKGKKIKS